MWLVRVDIAQPDGNNLTRKLVFSHESPAWALTAGQAIAKDEAPEGSVITGAWCGYYDEKETHGIDR